MSDRFQQEFKANIFPSDWVNPQPAAAQYDLLVLGSGPGGIAAATTAKKLGAKVALVEKEHLGGECLSYGCIPSKALFRSTRLANEIRKSKEFGLETRDFQVDFKAVIQRVHRLQALLSPHDSPTHFKDLGIDLFLGSGHFTSLNTLDVKNQTIHFKKAIIVTGTEAAPLKVAGLEPQDYLTNQNIFNLTTLPPRLAVIGAGPIGCELAQAFLHLGSKVTLITHGFNLLPKDDPLATDRLKNVFESDGMKIYTHSGVSRVEKKGNEKFIYIDTHPEPIVVDAILVAVGRKPVVEGLGLEKANIEFDLKNGINTNEYLQTSNPNIYAAGDVTSPYKFTHISAELSQIAAKNALNGNQTMKNSLIIPWCTFTNPEIAHVGLTEDAARKMGMTFESVIIELNDVDRAIIDEQTTGFVKLLAHEDQIIGATLMATHAGEMISEITTAMHSKNGLTALANAIHPFPTQAEILRKAADALLKKSRVLQSSHL